MSSVANYWDAGSRCFRANRSDFWMHAKAALSTCGDIYCIFTTYHVKADYFSNSLMMSSGVLPARSALKLSTSLWRMTG